MVATELTLQATRKKFYIIVTPLTMNYASDNATETTTYDGIDKMGMPAAQALFTTQTKPTPHAEEGNNGS